MEPTILLETEDFLALNKPAGLMVHGDGRGKELTLCDWLLEHFPNLKDVGEPLTLQNGEVIKRPGIVHRLDRDTSGVMVVAKNQEAFVWLKQQFQDHKVDKTYRAFVYGKLKEKRDIIDRPIARSRSDFRLWSAQRGSRGELRNAVTHYEVLEEKDRFSFIEAKPRTGRTHQIRVHFKALSHPIVCDKLYAPKGECAFGFERVALHSYKVSFVDLAGKPIEVTAPYPEDFEAALEAFRAEP